MARTLPMGWRELVEGRRAGIPEGIIGKLGQGIEPTEQEKNVINRCGKEYVTTHTRVGKRIKPHLRDKSELILTGGSIGRGTKEQMRVEVTEEGETRIFLYATKVKITEI